VTALATQLNIVVAPAEILTIRAAEVDEFEQETRELDALMRLIVTRPGVAGISLPQLGRSLRGCAFRRWDSTIVVVFNPLLEVHPNVRKQTMPEGCLSLPGVKVDVARYTEVTMVGQDFSGQGFELELRGHEAAVAQHEVDHLDGVLITDHGPAISA
jgi:peptide deformylase